MVEQIFEGVYRFRNAIATRSLSPGFRVHGEKTFQDKGEEYREWNSNKSKLSAAIARGLKKLPLHPGDKVLYLGAANGVTPSFVSDIVGENGEVFCVEFSPTAMRDLIRVCEKRENMIPILADARRPKEYEEIGLVDCLYEDVADSQQAEILNANADLLKKHSHAMIAVKARCIDSSEEPRAIYEQVKKKLAARFELVQEIELDPYEVDHTFLVLRKK